MRITAYIGNQRPKGISHSTRLLVPTGRIKTGGDCSFVPIGKRALKIFMFKRSCKYARDNQKKAAQKGIAPKCSKQIRKYLFDNKEVYGFWTQIAKPCKYIKNQTEMNFLLKSFKNLFGFEYVDLVTRNFGRVEGNLVILDFGVNTLWH